MASRGFRQPRVVRAIIGSQITRMEGTRKRHTAAEIRVPRQSILHRQATRSMWDTTATDRVAQKSTRAPVMMEWSEEAAAMTMASFRSCPAWSSSR